MSKNGELSVKQEEEVTRQLQIIERGVAEIVPKDSLLAKIRKSVATNTPLRIKLGLDPTAPDIHLGHTVVLQKIRQLQDLGHQVQIVIGDFTAQIGDPTGKSVTRKQLSQEEVQENAKTYVQQLFKVLNPSKTEVVYNSAWLAPLQFADVIKLASSLTVARMLEREDFTKRYKENKPIHIHEFFYPLMQGYDSVALQSDIELGGTDQTFNLLMGRTLQKEFSQEMQVAITMPLLEGLDGVQKMSKSLGNYIGVDEEPNTIFGKAMSIPDNLIPKYFELVSGISLDELKKLTKGLQEGSLHPRDAELRLAKELVQRFCGEAAAEEAARHWNTVFQQGSVPADVPEFQFSANPIWIVKALVEAGFASSNGEARRAIEQGSVKINGTKVEDPKLELHLKQHDIIQAGKRKFVKVCL
ncbi:tyrosine--tRNA ligase [Bacillus sp. 165]|uniref:tyrosine--tRNA ligase n=1 Tax=Bacillus sp. 165 TaxID=1529117 RepID=UPI001ADB005E|nr:tyrosine--tRNA ligase [Bacillus sp. 165]MBO9129365.1 tyrosine--tRNA ligase [Bacillus sp. 165]